MITSETTGPQLPHAGSAITIGETGAHLCLLKSAWNKPPPLLRDLPQMPQGLQLLA